MQKQELDLLQYNSIGNSGTGLNCTEKTFRRPLFASPIHSFGLLVLGTLCLSGPTARAQSTSVTGNDVLTVTGSQHYDQIAALDNSHVNVLGGAAYPPTYNVNTIYDYDNASVNVSGGVVQLIIADDTASVLMSSGVVTSEIATQDQSVVSITGGSIQQLDLEQAQSATVSGGSISYVFSANANATVTGGTFNTLETLIRGNITMYGTNFSVLSSTPETFTNSTYTYTGSVFMVSGLLEGNSAPATYRLFDSTYQTRLSDGSVINATGDFIFDDLQTGNVIAVNANAPEPDAVAILVAALPFVAGSVIWKRRHDVLLCR